MLLILRVIGADYQLSRAEVHVIGAAGSCRSSLVLRNLLSALVLDPEMVLLEVGPDHQLFRYVVLLFVKVVLQRLLQGIHSGLLFLRRRLLVLIDVVVELQELVVKVLFRHGRLRSHDAWLVARASSDHTIRLHKILLHLVVNNI